MPQIVIFVQTESLTGQIEETVISDFDQSNPFD